MATVARRQALAASLGPDVDALLVTNLVNVRYLTGFTGSNAALLLDRDAAAVLATDGRYAVQAADEAPDPELLVARALGPDLVRHAAAAGHRRLAIERAHVTLTSYDALRGAAGDDVE